MSHFWQWAAFGLLGMSFCGTNVLAAELKVGDPAPDFSLQGSDGKTYKLSALKGKTVVVAWFPRAFTWGCMQECRSFKEGGDAIRAFDVVYFTASTDDVEKNTKFAKSLEADYTILSDPTAATAAAFGVVTEAKPAADAARWTFFIGPNGKILAIDKEFKVENAGKIVAAKLKELGVAAK